MDFDDQSDNEEHLEQQDDLLFDLEDTTDQWKSKKDSVIFLIDINQQLFDFKINGKSQFEIIQESMSSFLKSKIIANENDKIGVIFYNTQTMQNPLNFKNVNMMFSLELPSADRIKEVDQLHNSFNQKFGISKDESPLYEALWVCSHEFKNLDSSSFNKRIFLITNEDYPNSHNKYLQDQAIQYSKNLSEMDVQIELFPIQKSSSSYFNINKFYIDFIQFDENEVNYSSLDSSQKIMDLNKRLRSKEFKKRVLGRVKFNLGQGVQIGIGVYCLLHKSKLPYGKNLNGLNNNILNVLKKFQCKQSWQYLYPNQIKTCVHIGGEKVPFSNEDMIKIKTFDPPGLTLIGFRSRSFLKTHYNIKPSYFLYPDDQLISNSSQAANALIKQMILKDKIAIVKFVPKQSSAIKFCALIAQNEQYDEDNFQIPPGFHCIFLPYADDLRSVKEQAYQNPFQFHLQIMNFFQKKYNGSFL